MPPTSTLAPANVRGQGVEAADCGGVFARSSPKMVARAPRERPAVKLAAWTMPLAARRGLDPEGALTLALNATLRFGLVASLLTKVRAPVCGPDPEAENRMAIVRFVFALRVK